MKNILMITTGGTIACINSEDGFIPQIKGNHILDMVPALKNMCKIDVLEIMNIDSSNITPKEWLVILNTLENNYEKYDGFVITHGTDTMAYTSSFLSNAVTGLGKPVILTGSQIPASEKGSDALDNIYHAFLTAVNGAAGVFLVFNGKIHTGSSVKKIYSEDFTGFLSINKETAGYFKDNKIVWNIKHKKTNEKTVFNKKISDKVFVLTIIPSLKPDIVDVLVNMGYKGIIIQGFGNGGVPGKDSENNFLPALKNAVSKGVVVVCATQCLYNGVHLDKYPEGIMAEKYGACSAKNQTLENITTKLMIALAGSMNMQEIKKYIEME